MNYTYIIDPVIGWGIYINFDFELIQDQNKAKKIHFR